MAAYAQGSYEPVIVFDAAGNLSDVRLDFSSAGVRIVFSKTGESADTVIERLVTMARHENRDVLLVTSDNTIRFTVGGVPVTSISSQLLATDIGTVAHDAEVAREERSHGRMTLEDRLSPKAREKLWKLLGRWLRGGGCCCACGALGAGLFSPTGALLPTGNAMRFGATFEGQLERICVWNHKRDLDCAVGSRARGVCRGTKGNVVLAEAIWVGFAAMMLPWRTSAVVRNAIRFSTEGKSGTKRHNHASVAQW